MTEAADISSINAMLLGVSFDVSSLGDWIVLEVNFPRDELS